MHFKVMAPLALMLAITAFGCSDDDDKDDNDDDQDIGDVDNGTPPTITSFAALNPAITPGASTVLSWTVDNATSVTLQAAAATGTSLLVTPAATTTYTLVATNAAGSVDADVTVTVSAAASSVPTSPIAYNKNEYFWVDNYTQDRMIVPSSYDDTHATPTRLLIWLHGCGGQSEFEIGWLSEGGPGQTWLALSPGGREGQCWDMNTVTDTVLRSLAKAKTQFNIDPKRIFIGGYSSGGDASYRIAFYHALQFAGVLAENTSPFRDTGSSQAASLAAAAWKFNVVQLAHTEDDTYPIAGVIAEVNAMKAAGWDDAATLVQRPGGHYDDPGTVDDARLYLRPQITGPWTAP